MSPGGSKSSVGDSGDSGAGGGNTNDESRAGREGIAIGSSDASRGNMAEVGDICTDFRRKNVEIGVVAEIQMTRAEREGRG